MKLAPTTGRPVTGSLAMDVPSALHRMPSKAYTPLLFICELLPTDENTASLTPGTASPLRIHMVQVPFLAAKVATSFTPAVAPAPPRFDRNTMVPSSISGRAAKVMGAEVGVVRLANVRSG